MALATRIGALCSPLALLLLSSGWIAAGFFPPISPSLTPEQLVAHYRSHEAGIKACVPLWLMFGGLNVVFRATVSTVLSRIENCSKVLVRVQLAGSIYTFLLSVLAALFFAIAVLRPSRSPELLQLLNDAGQFTAIFDAQSMVIQDLATACAILRDSSLTPIFPRWLGYSLLLSVLALLPSFYAHVELKGPGAWDGMIGFWIPTMIFGNNMSIISWFVWKSAGRKEERVGVRED